MFSQLIAGRILKEYFTQIHVFYENSGGKMQQSSTVISSILALALILSGCAGREPRPVAATNPNDSVMDCAGIQREFEANERQLVTTVDERTNANVKNIVFGAVGATVFLPALFFLDLKTPEKIEINALRNRNGVLLEMAKSKKCPAPQTKIQAIYDWMDGKTVPEETPRP